MEIANIRQPRQPGALKGKIKIAEDFDTLPDDIAAAYGLTDRLPSGRPLEEKPIMTDASFHELSYPSSRQLTFDLGRIGRNKHQVKAMLEVDDTAGRNRIKQIRQSGGKASFTAWFIKLIADCVALHPPRSG